MLKEKTKIMAVKKIISDSILENLPKYLQTKIKTDQINAKEILKRNKSHFKFEINYLNNSIFICEGQKLFHYTLNGKKSKIKLEGHKRELKNFAINKTHVYR